MMQSRSTRFKAPERIPFGVGEFPAMPHEVRVRNQVAALRAKFVKLDENGQHISQY